MAVQHLVDNRYRVVWTLVSNEMTEVHLARDDILGRDIVLKVLSKPYTEDDEFVEHFRKEARGSARLSHPNIVSVFDQGETEDGTYYIAMEYLPGGDLKERLAKLGPIPARRAAAVALQVSRALWAAHEGGVVHGGLKPNSVLITESGDVKVKDFGIAGAVSSTTTDGSDTRHSDPYLSPEQAAGGEASRKSDLYSLGVILYEMLTGEPPQDNGISAGSTENEDPGDPGEPAGGDDPVSEGVNAIVMALISRNPDDRYSDAGELVEDLKRVGAGLEPDNAGTRTSLQLVPYKSDAPRRAELRRSRFPGRILLLVLTALAAVLLSGLAWAGSGLLTTSTQEQQPDPQPEPRPDPRPEPQPVMLPVPDLEGMTLEEAQKKVGDDFDVVQDGTENSSRPENTILSHKPSGEQAEKGTEIRAVVASGRNEVPAVESSTLEEARKALSDAGFEPTVAEAESAADAEGLIISQSPAGGGAASVGSLVEITVGTGPAPVEVPSLYGYTADEAAAQLQSIGLALGGSDTASSDEVAEGSIISQSVAPGAVAEPGTVVGVTISSGPEMIPVPNVVGQTLSQARQNVSGAGFSYNVLEIPNAQWPRGTVLYTDPGTGALILPGSPVTIGYSSGPTAPKPAASNQNNQEGQQSRNRPARTP